MSSSCRSSFDTSALREGLGYSDDTAATDAAPETEEQLHTENSTKRYNGKEQNKGQNKGCNVV